MKDLKDIDVYLLCKFVLIINDIECFKNFSRICIILITFCKLIAKNIICVI